MTTYLKIVIGIVLLTLVIIFGGTWLSSRQSAKNKERLSKPLLGEEIITPGSNHVSEGTKVDYKSNPPTSGPHYVNTKSAGIYDKPIPEGNLLHSMEPGPVIIWYQSNLPKEQVEQLKNIYNEASAGKKIMVPRDDLDVPVALTSWGRLLKLQTIDEVKIKEFIETNNNRAPEKAPI